MPLYVGLSQSETIEEALLRLDYSDVWETLYALADYDELLASAIRAVSQRFRETGEMNIHPLNHKILIEAPLVNAQLLQQSILTLCLEKLGSGWEKRYDELVAYKARYGHCKVTSSFKNKPLASWVMIQRSQYRQRTLSQEKIAKLSALGFQWEFPVWGWQESYEALKKYKEEYGNYAVNWRGPNNRLAQWIQRQRINYRTGTLSTEKVNQLQAIGFPWGAPKLTWEDYYAQLSYYKKKHGDCNVPETEENEKLAGWCRRQRYKCEAGKLSQEKIVKLNALGFEWEQSLQAAWDRGYRALLDYKEKYGHCNVPQRWKENTLLANWVRVQRNASAKGKLKEDKINKLNAIGFEWNRSNETWLHRYTALVRYKKKYGHCKVPQRWSKNKTLANWVKIQRSLYRKEKLSEQKIAQLNALGFEWTTFKANWQAQYDKLLRYKKKYGHCNITDTRCKNKRLTAWLGTQRAEYKKGRLNPARVTLLESLGIQ